MGNTAQPNRQLYEVTQDSQQNDETVSEEKTEINMQDIQAILQLYSQIMGKEIDEEIEKQQNTQVNIKEDFKVYVGIDFGTNGCGICYAVKNELLPQKDSSDSDSDSSDAEGIECDEKTEEENYRIFVHKWDDLAYDNSKLNTCILLDDNNQFQMFGNHARISFTEMQKKNWKLFDNFKMSLYGLNTVNNEENDDQKQRELNAQVRSYNGQLTASDIVFKEALKHLKKAAMEYINDRLDIPNISVDDIQWILTIPSIWNHAAKYMMRKWGKESGLINENITNHLKIVLEPECASLQIQYEFRNHEQIKFNKNDKYILIDAGGGTCDIVAHTIYSDFGVKEIIPSTGGPYGSVNIDKMLEQLFDEVFGKENMDDFRKNFSKNYVKMFEEVIQSKCDFYANDNMDEEDTKQEYSGGEYHSITLNPKFWKEMKQLNTKLKKNIKKMEKVLGVPCQAINVDVQNKEYLLKINDRSTDFVYLEIHKNLWKKIFDECCIEPIIGICYKIMQNNDVLKDLKYIFMVGGLSKSKYFQQRMKKRFSNICIVVPENPLLSVVSGAARYGLQTDFVHTRILKQTYAVRVSESIYSLCVENELRKIMEYMKSNDDSQNQEMEEKINAILEDKKDALFTEVEIENNNNSEQLRALLLAKIEEMIPERAISDEWLKNNYDLNRFAVDSEDQFICNKLLSVLASKGQEIVINSKERITKQYSRHSKQQKMSHIQIYCSDVVDPRRVDETENTKQLCEGILKYTDDAVLDVIFELSFDDSLLIAYAYPKGKREERAEVAIEYQTN